MEAVVTLFELALFNSQVYRHFKSSSMIDHRVALFDFLEENEFQLDMEDQENDWQLQVRLNYAMMFYAFEIRSDMVSSIAYYRRIEGLLAGHETKVELPWVKSSHVLDSAFLREYGCGKIQEAQVSKHFDDRLKELKLLEKQELEDAQKAGSKSYSPIKPEFRGFARFYIDQLFKLF